VLNPYGKFLTLCFLFTSDALVDKTPVFVIYNAELLAEAVPTAVILALPTTWSFSVGPITPIPMLPVLSILNLSTLSFALNPK
jgi:hypothetical protein